MQITRNASRKPDIDKIIFNQSHPNGKKIHALNRKAYSNKTFFFHQDFLSRTLTTHRTAEEWRGPFLFHFTTFSRSRTFRHLFATFM